MKVDGNGPSALKVSSIRSPAGYPDRVYTDTTNLWSIDAVVDDELPDRRGKLGLANLCDVVCDPNRDLRCILPSRERAFGPTPQFYRALHRVGLLPKEDLVIDPSSIDPSGIEHFLLASQLRRFRVQCEFQTDVNSEWIAVHFHQKVIGGRSHVPERSTDPEYLGVPEAVVEFLNGAGAKEFKAILATTHWDKRRAAHAFSIVSRGWSYWQEAGKQGAEYLSHPMRWQVLLDQEQKHEPPAPGFGPAIGGILLGSIQEGRLKPDAQAICDRLARIRDNAGNLWGRGKLAPLSGNRKNDQWVIEDLMAGVVGRPWKKPVAAGFRLALDAAAVVAARLNTDVPAVIPDIGLLVADRFNKWLIDKGLPAKMTSVSVFRRLLNYSARLNMASQVCPWCGSELQSGFCRLERCPGGTFLRQSNYQS